MSYVCHEAKYIATYHSKEFDIGYDYYECELHALHTDIHREEDKS